MQVDGKKQAIYAKIIWAVTFAYGRQYRDCGWDREYWHNCGSDIFQKRYGVDDLALLSLYLGEWALTMW
jgi:hypothetical protein